MQTYRLLGGLGGSSTCDQDRMSHLRLDASQGHENELMEYMPSTLRKRALQHMFAKRVKHVYLFKDGTTSGETVSTRFLDALLTLAKIELYVPPVDIVEQGSFVADLLILTHGFAKVKLRLILLDVHSLHLKRGSLAHIFRLPVCANKVRRSITSMVGNTL